MNYPDFVKELRELLATSTPNGNLIDNLVADILTSVTNLQPDQALAALTCLQSAAQEARTTVAEDYINGLDFDKTTGEKYLFGKNFTTPNQLVLRVNTKCDYNYQANDDLAAEFGMNLTALLNTKNGYDEQSKLFTGLIKQRKKLIQHAHPRMLPLPGTVKHSVSFIGTATEVQRRRTAMGEGEE
jgi:hypothetical protein